MITKFFNGFVLRNHSFIYEDLWIQNETIIAPSGRCDDEVDLQGLMAAPGYIDLQLNGCFGVDFNSANPDVAQAAKELPRFGVAAFLPTLITAPQYKFDPFQRNIEGAEILGIHLEGPFLNAKFAGAHLAAYMVPPKKELFDSSFIKLITLAPELDSALQLIKFFADSGIVLACGHSEASSAILNAAKKQGLKMATHLFNAMAPLTARDPGIIGTILSDKSWFYSIIADGIHVADEGIRLAYNANPEGLILISDGITSMGLEGSYTTFAGMAITIEGKKAMKSNRLAGGLTPMDQQVRNLIAITNCSKEFAIEAASLKPAQLLNETHRLGTLNIGSQASFNLLDSNLEVKSCYVKGQRFFNTL